jgi:catechol 2,3-dioxygenase-like lactoylglutathione lyase family enzyme
MLSDRFRAAVERGNVDEAAELFSEGAAFRSPVLFKPYEGRDQVVKVLHAAERVLGVGGEFRYVHQLEDADDRVAMLEFATVVDGLQVEGIDKLTFDDDGLITELKVMIRPASALQLVGARMAEESPRSVFGFRAERMEINGVAHIILRISRFEQCVAFYDALMPRLGLEVVYRSDDSVYYVGGRTAVGIRRPAPGLAGHAHKELAPGIDHLCFRARSREDIDELYPLLAEFGAELVRAPEEGPWAPGYYSLSFRDPEGIRLEVNHVPGEGVLAEGTSFTAAPGHPLRGTRRSLDSRS